MPATPGRTRVSVRAVRLRAGRARHAVTSITRAAPAVADICGQVSDSLTDIDPMASEITGLRRDLARTRLARANLSAAGRAAIAAGRDGEPDPFSYLRDELDAQGHAGQVGPA